MSSESNLAVDTDENHTENITRNDFLTEWEAIEDPKTQPLHCREVNEIEFDELEKKVLAQDPTFVKAFVKSLYAGDAYIVNKAFSKEFMLDLKEKVHQYWSQQPSTFHKMLEGCPDYHRIIDEENTKKYAIKMGKHSCYFYPWNDDPLNLFPTVWKRWRIFKFLGGFPIDAYEKNTPKDGIVDRIQVVRYPPKIGYLEKHSDPYQSQRVILSGFMSKRGVDYQGGGFYLIDKNKNKFFPEDIIDTGDIGICYATVNHGVDPVDIHKSPDWSAKDGRWFLSMYSNMSDEVENRETLQAVK